jgi:hypothetical protein
VQSVAQGRVLRATWAGTSTPAWSPLESAE